MPVSTSNPPTSRDSSPTHRQPPSTRRILSDRTLRRVLIESGRLDWREVVTIGIQIGEQLESYHARGRCPHGAVSPENIFQSPDGLTYQLGAPLVEVEPAYSPPEVLHGGPETPDASSDVFSLGVVLFEALAGNHCVPFRVQQRITGAAREWSFMPTGDARTALSHVPPAVRRVVEQATRLVPANRFTTPTELIAALRSVEGAAEEVEPRSSESTAEDAPGRWRALLAVSVVAFVFVAASALLVAPYFISSPAEEEASAARTEALAASAPNLAAEAWERAESPAPGTDFAMRARLYREARDLAWHTLHQRVANAEKEAAAFDATGEPLYARALEARQRAEQAWLAGRHAEAVRRLNEAEEFFTAAHTTRRQRLVARLEEELAREQASIRAHLPEGQSADFDRRLAEIRSAIRRPTATLPELHAAQERLAELRQQIAGAMAEAGARAAARRSAEESLSAAEADRRSVASLGKVFPALAGALERGEAFLASAREALDADPARAVALADAARERFRAARASAEREVVGQRQAALRAQQKASQPGVEEHAAADLERAQSAWQRAEEAFKVGDLAVAKSSFVEARNRFDAALRDAEMHAEEDARQAARATMQKLDTRNEPPRAPAIEVQPPAAIAAVPTPAAPRAPSPLVLPPKPSSRAPDKELGPMPPLLAQAIQTWLAEHCRDLDRTLVASQGRRARCNELTVLDRRDLGSVKVSFQLATGPIAPDGIRWDRTDSRAVTLDCRGSSCRCVSGDGC